MRLLTAEDLAKRYLCSLSRINQLPPDKLPPRFKLPGNRRRLWREDVVEGWEKSLPGGSPVAAPQIEVVPAIESAPVSRGKKGRPSKPVLAEPANKKKRAGSEADPQTAHQPLRLDGLSSAGT